MKNFAAVLFLLSLAVRTLHAQPADVAIRVLDAETAAPLAEAAVSIGDRMCTTDREGRCTLAHPPADTPLEVRAEGYADQAIAPGELTRAADGAVEVRLITRGRFQEQVEVVAPDAPPQGPAQIPVKPADVVNVAGGAENIFHVLQTLPGVASPEEFSGRLSVRGGGPDENLTVMDGVEIHNPYRLFGLVSAFNPETVESFDLAAGAFDARYGDRLSSLLLVRSRAGTTEHALAGTAALSLTDTNVIGEGRAPFGSGSWLVAARRTYYDLVAERFTEQDLPSFTDLQGKAHFEIGGGRTFTLFGLRSRESSDATFDDREAGESGAFTSRTRNDVLAATLHAPLGSRLSSRTIASAYVNTEAVDFDGDFRNTGKRSNAPGDEAFGKSEVQITWESRVRDSALRQELTWQVSPRHVVEAGAEMHRLDTRIRFVIPADRNPQEANGSSLQGGALLPDDLDSRRQYTRFGGWLQTRLHLSSRWLVEPGVRFDRSGANARTSFAPRLSSTFALGSAMRLRGAAGLYTQSVGYEKLVQADYFMDLSGTAPLDLENERSYHALLGIERDLAPGVLARAEVYYKTFDQLVVGRLETPEETASRVAEYDFPADLASSVPRQPWVTTFPTNGGKGHAYGFDLYLSRRGGSSDRVTGWASYTFGLARREAYGLEYPFDYDRRHAVSVVGNLRLSRKLELAATARVSSGFPRTPVVGLRVTGAPDIADIDRDGNRTELVPERDPAGRLVYATDLGGIENTNTARLPMYARVDARLTYTPGGPKGRVKFYLDVINVTARENAGFMDPVLVYDPESDRPRLTEERTASIPFLPSLGIHVNFAKRASSASSQPLPPVATAPPAPRAGATSGWALVGRPLSTLGPGLEVTRRIVPRLNARLAVGLPLDTTTQETASDTEYDMEVAMGGGLAALDLMPFGGRFRVSAGMLRSRHGFALTSIDAASIDVGGRMYSGEELTRLTGTATVKRWAPYFGLGWGNPLRGGNRYRVLVDVGVAPQGKPLVVLNGAGPAAGTPEFAERLAVETRDLSDRLKGWAWYPVISVSVSRRF